MEIIALNAFSDLSAYLLSTYIIVGDEFRVEVVSIVVVESESKSGPLELNFFN